MIIHIFVDEPDKDILQRCDTALEKAEFKDDLYNMMVDRTFKMAIVGYDNGRSVQINSMQDLEGELGKFGI